ncbi:MAG: tRNA (adenosine(37)-N6)-threonylcarbamoyltransferase complex transferase subunit TsaD [Elusimicrobiales bacterium]
MRILAIETSCDETSVAVVEGRSIVYHKICSQVPHHKKYSGVVPEIASRLHARVIADIIKKGLVKKPHVVGFTRGPGLKGSLLVGKIAAMCVGGYFGSKIVGVNHLEGHLLSCDIEDNFVNDLLEFPLVALIVSGGHTELWYSQGYGMYKRIGRTRDDACGEAFDKVARIIGLGYPGGPEIEKYANKAKKGYISFSVPNVPYSLDYSFSGIKTQVMYYVREMKRITDCDRYEIAYAFQNAVCESLVKKLEIAAKRFRVKNLAVCGGVSANSYLRQLIKKRFKEYKVYMPHIKYTSDNAAMIAACIIRRLERGRFKNSLDIDDCLVIENW